MTLPAPTTFTTAELAQRVGGQLIGDPHIPISGIESLEHAGPEHLTLIADKRYADRWPQSRAAAALVKRGIDPQRDHRPLILVDDVDVASALLLAAFAPPMPDPGPGVHHTAVVDPSAALGEGCRIGPGCVIGPHVVLGERCVLHANVTLMDHARIGRECILWPGVVIRERCTLGDRCILHPNVTIGADGFGYRPSPDGRGLVKIPQIGAVTIGHDVEIGAGSCVDRGKFSATVLGDGCKLDNLVQIAHNCRLGRCVVIAAHTALGGSVRVDDGALIGGMVCVKEHCHIGAGAKLGGGSQLMHDIPPGEMWSGIPATDSRTMFKRYAAIAKLPDHLRGAPSSPKRQRGSPSVARSASEGPQPVARSASEGPQPRIAANPSAFSATYHLIWTTHGTWLPGDARGWVSKTSSGTQPPDPAIEQDARQHMIEPPVELTAAERQLVERTIHEHCGIRGWRLHALNVRSNHVHIVVTADRDGDEAMSQFKAWCSRKLSDAAGVGKASRQGNGRRKWFTERGWWKVIENDEYLHAAIRYVNEFQ